MLQRIARAQSTIFYFLSTIAKIRAIFKICQTIMNITIVKKIKPDGSLCRKSAEVTDKLYRLNLSDRIDRVVFADDREYSSPGLELARKHGVKAAPFFIVEQEEATLIYTKYSRFIKEVLDCRTSESEEIDEIMAQYPDLDFI